MILDTYLVIIVEVAVSIILPLVLTLKSLQLAQLPKDAFLSVQLLTFWLIYWLGLFLLQLAGVNSHCRSLFTVYYLGRNRGVLRYLLKFYQNTFLTSASRLLQRSLTVSITEGQLDSKVESLLRRVCFEPEFWDKILNLFSENDQPVIHKRDSPNRSRVSSGRRQVSEQNSTKEDNFVPLELIKQRRSVSSRDNTVKNSRNTSTSSMTIENSNSVSTKPSKSNIRSRNVSSEFTFSPEHNPQMSSPKGLNENNDTFTRLNNLAIHSNRWESVRNIFTS